MTALPRAQQYLCVLSMASAGLPLFSIRRRRLGTETLRPRPVLLSFANGALQEVTLVILEARDKEDPMKLQSKKAAHRTPDTSSVRASYTPSSLPPADL